MKTFLYILVGILLVIQGYTSYEIYRVKREANSMRDKLRNIAPNTAVEVNWRMRMMGNYKLESIDGKRWYITDTIDKNNE